MEIKLTKGFFVEQDEWQYILKQRYTAKSKDGEEREQVKVVGYYKTITQVVEKYIFMLGSLLQDDRAVSLREYAKIIEKSNKEAVKGVKSLVSSR